MQQINAMLIGNKTIQIRVMYMPVVVEFVYDCTACKKTFIIQSPLVLYVNYTINVKALNS